MRSRCVMLWSFAMVMILSMLTISIDAKDIDLVALTQETQIISQKPGEITMVWWIPEEFWSTSFAQTPGMTALQSEKFLKIIRPYTMLVAVDGTIGAFGGVTYKSEDYIRANTRLEDLRNKSYAPRTEDEVDADTKNMLQMIKPILSNMLGSMGQNMHFLLFPGKTETGSQIASAKEKGEFKVKLGEKEFKWRLPLDAVLSSKTCSGCKQECKGSWSFCPWCGMKLMQK